MRDKRTSKQKVKSLLRDFGVVEVEKETPLMEMVEGGMEVPHITNSARPSDADDPDKLNRAKEKLEALKITRGLGTEIVASVAKKITKTNPAGNTFESKIKHALAVQRAVEGINLYDAVEDYCRSIGIERPSKLGIYEAIKGKQTRDPVEG